MTILYGLGQNSSGIATACVGYYLEENVEYAGEISVRARIYSDYYAQYSTAPSNTFLSAIVCPITFVNSYNELLIREFGGNPPRLRFGNIATGHDNLAGDSYFINHENQLYPSYLCMVNPTPLDFPDTMSALPPFEEFSSILLASNLTVGFANSLVEPRYSMSALYYSLEDTVNATIGFYYFCYANSFFPASSDLLLVGL